MDTYEQVATAIKAITPLGRTGMPEDIGLIAAFLAFDEARWLTGEIILGVAGSVEYNGDTSVCRCCPARKR